MCIKKYRIKMGPSKRCVWQPGSLATSCNPSSGTALFRWICSTGQVWSNPDQEKGNLLIAGHLCIHPTTQQLYQGAGDAGKTRPEEPLWCRVQGHGFESTEEKSAFFISNLAIMIVFIQCAHSVVCWMLNHCNLWQTLLWFELMSLVISLQKI